MTLEQAGDQIAQAEETARAASEENRQLKDQVAALEAQIETLQAKVDTQEAEGQALKESNAADRAAITAIKAAIEKGWADSLLTCEQHAALFEWLGAKRLTAVYRSSRDGTTLDDLLGCVGTRTGLAIIIKKDTYLFGVYINAGLQLPDDRSRLLPYWTLSWWARRDVCCDVWFFSLAGHFPKPTKMNITRQQIVDVAGRKYGNTSAVIEAGVPLSYLVHHHLVHLRLGEFPETGITSCYQYTPSENVPAGYTGERDEGGNALLGGSKYSMADEIEVLHVAGQ